MAVGRTRRDKGLLDALEAIAPVPCSAPVWRVVQQGRDPVQCSRSGGRWDDERFDVLYTAQTKAGAIAEMRFHLMRGQPVFPSRLVCHLYEIDLALKRKLKLADMAALARLGLDTARFGQLSYQQKRAEYPRSQDIGEAAHFLGFDGLLVPSARHDCANVVVFCDRVPVNAMSIRKDHGPVSWEE